MEAKRVVITGMGTVNPLGNDVNSTWENVIKGKSGIGTITAFPVDTYRCQVAGMVKKFDLENYYKESSVSRANKLDKYVHYAVAATKEALENANLNVLDYQDETGIVLGTGIGGMNISQESVRILFDKGHRKVSPFSVPGIIPNTAAGFVSIEFGIKGANFAVSSACASGNHSISVAMMIIQTGQAKVMIAGGSESSINKIVLAGFENMKALATSYNARPTEASRPYDKDREGFVMGEGAGTLILEEYEFAKKRKANILCEIASVGMTSDAFDLVSPDPDGNGAEKSMKIAMERAKVNPEDIDYVNAHGTSTPLGDIAESKAILKAVEGKQDNLTVGSTKSMTGHLLGAASALESIICIKSILENKIPPNINIDNFDEKVPLKCINTQLIEKKVDTVLSNSFGFGGHNSTLCLKAV